MERARQLIGPVAKERQVLDDLDRAAQAWRQTMAERGIALMATHATRGQALAIEASGAGKTSMDAIRAYGEAIGSAVNADLRTSATAQADSFSMFRTTTVSGVVLVLIIAGLIS